MTTRSNDLWLEVLRSRGNAAEEAVDELAIQLRRAVSKSTRGQLDAEAVADVVQESIRRILERLASFRGDSAFTTWATSIALHVALTEVRRRSARKMQHAALEAAARSASQQPSQDLPAPDELLSRSHLHQVLGNAIITRLTERQRFAIVAELRGIPTVEIARHLDTNVNALYKLVHDARRRLRAVLLEAGFTAESLHTHAIEPP